jgi:hypothetical protein
MPRAELTKQQITRIGIVATYTTVTAADGGRILTPAGTHPDLFLHVKNNGGGTAVLTLPIASTVDDQAVEPKEVVIAAGGQQFWGPFTEDYDHTEGGFKVCYVDVSATLEVAALWLKE